MNATLKHYQNQLKQYGQPLATWFAALQPREQLLVRVLLLALLLTLAVLLIWQPITGSRDQALARYQREASLYYWIDSNAEAIRQQRGAAQAAAVSSGDWISELSRSAAGFNLALRSFNPEGDSAVRIQLESQPFAETLAWLELLALEQGIAVASVEFTPTTSPGLINLRATLKRGR